MSPAVTRKDSGAPCRNINSDICNIATISFSLSYTFFDSSGNKWAGSAATSASRVTFRHDCEPDFCDTLDPEDFAIYRGHCCCCREVKFQKPEDSQFGSGTVQEQFTPVSGSPPPLATGLSFINIINGTLFSVRENVGLGDFLNCDITIPANPITLAEWIGTHPITIPMPGGMSTGSGTAIWTIT
jgi:hypothetical protein